MKYYLGSGARVRHETSHSACLQAPPLRRNNPPTIPTTLTNRNPQQTTVSVRRHCKEELQCFVQHILYYSSLNLDRERHQNLPGSPSPGTPQRLSTKWSMSPKSRKMRYPRPNYSPRPQLNYCLILVWYTQFFIRPEIKGNKNLPFPQRHFSPSTTPLPSTPKRTRKTPGPESAREKGPKPLNFSSTWTNFLPTLGKFCLL